MVSDNEVKTVQKILKNKHNVIREGVNIYKCIKCEGTQAGKSTLVCKDKNCRGQMKFLKRIPQEKVEEITSRRSARQCPSCMKLFYIWVESCPYCSTPTLKGKITRKDDRLAKMYEYKMHK